MNFKKILERIHQNEKSDQDPYNMASQSQFVSPRQFYRQYSHLKRMMVPIFGMNMAKMTQMAMMRVLRARMCL